MNRYQILVHGHLNDHWSSWFEGWRFDRKVDGTMFITGTAVDQSALVGMVNRVHQASLPLISLRWIGIEDSDNPQRRTDTMRYLMFVYSNPNKEERPMEEWMAFHSQYGASGKLQVAERLYPVEFAKTVQPIGQSDGSLIRGDMFISGVYIVDCADMEEALQIATECPASKSGAVEVRQILMPPQS